MLISYKNKFIFIHNYKVAGSSITKALSKHALITPSRITVVNKLSENYSWSRNLNFIISRKLKFVPSFNVHAGAQEIKEQISNDIWDNFYKFSFVRNPWDWQVSLYHYMLISENHFQHQLIKKMKSFDEYLEWRVNNDLHLQKENICDEQGNILLDFVGKIENINEDFETICKNLNIKNIHLPHINKSKHKNYRDYYNNFTKKLIADYFSGDIELFKYEF